MAGHKPRKTYNDIKILILLNYNKHFFSEIIKTLQRYGKEQLQG